MVVLYLLLLLSWLLLVLWVVLVLELVGWLGCLNLSSHWFSAQFGNWQCLELFLYVIVPCPMNPV